MPLNDATRWLDFAERDFNVAKHLFENFYPMQYEIICYHCQQAAEKAIKAVYIGNDLPGGIPKKHDLSFLLNQMSSYVAVSDDLLEYADELTPYGVTVRYPSEIEVGERDTRTALKYAEEILKWAIDCIKRLPSQE